jgi:hypothetical protein
MLSFSKAIFPCAALARFWMRKRLAQVQDAGRGGYRNTSSPTVHGASGPLPTSEAERKCFGAACQSRHLTRIIHRDGLERRGSRLLGGSGSTRSQHRLLRVRVSRLGCARCISDSHTEKVTAPRRMRSGRSKALFAACRDHLSRGLTDSRRAGPGSAARGLPRMAPRLRRGSGSCGGPR